MLKLKSQHIGVIPKQSLGRLSQVLQEVCSLLTVKRIPQGRRKPYDEEKTEKLIEFFGLTEEEIALMNDLAAREILRTALVPEDAKICKDAGDLESVAFLREIDLPDQSGA